jgi:aspartate carbamoyltransferase catalytic subunit
MDKPFRRRDLLGIRNLTAEEIVGILDTAENFREINQREIKKFRHCAVKPLSIFSLRLRRAHELPLNSPQSVSPPTQ